MIARLRRDLEVLIVPPSLELFDSGLTLNRDRIDKSWSPTDSISFIAMTRYGLTEALTADHHFEQAGFKALMLGG